MTEDSNERNIKFAALYFFAATIITWFFIELSPIYIGINQKILSCCIAGIKWNIQMIAALIFMDERRWEFLHKIAKTCFLGSIILIPYCLSCLMKLDSGAVFFSSSIVVSVSVMIVSYYLCVKKMQIGFVWLWGWLVSLALAILFQLYIVFHIYFVLK